MMKTFISSLILLAVLLLVCGAFAGELDPRFDGKWVGTEKFSYPSGGTTITARSPDTMIAIAEHGKGFGVLSGWVPGRYEVAPESRGNTLIYGMAGKRQSWSQGREQCKLVLSPDGNTLEETGHANLVVGADHQPTRCQLTGTFHRHGK